MMYIITNNKPVSNTSKTKNVLSMYITIIYMDCNTQGFQ